MVTRGTSETISEYFDLENIPKVPRDLQIVPLFELRKTYFLQNGFLTYPVTPWHSENIHECVSNLSTSYNFFIISFTFIIFYTLSSKLI